MQTFLELRSSIRKGTFCKTTSGICPGRVQANLVVLPERLALDFRLFCERNPKPCPLIEVTLPGDPVPRRSAPGADLRTDVPRYRVYRDGVLSEERKDISALWRDDFVSFLLGCSFTFESALARAGIPLRHQEEKKVVPMYVTNQDCIATTVFHGPLVVSMRPIKQSQVARAIDISSRYPEAHGAPVQTGRPDVLGIQDIERVDYGEAVTIRDGEVPVFWACGVTPQAVAVRARPELVITHAPGHMFITELDNMSPNDPTT